MSATDRFFAFADIFLKEKNVKSAVFLDKNLNVKLRAKGARKDHDFQAFFGLFWQQNAREKKKIKIVPTDRPLFGISSPVEQGFFFLALNKN